MVELLGKIDNALCDKTVLRLIKEKSLHANEMTAGFVVLEELKRIIWPATAEIRKHYKI